MLEGFKEQRTFLLLTTKAKKPDLTGAEMSVYQDLLKPINEALMAVGNIREANRGSAYFNQISAVSEGIMVLAWVTVDTKPHKHVEDSLASVQFFGNRVLKDHKDRYASLGRENSLRTDGSVFQEKRVGTVVTFANSNLSDPQQVEWIHSYYQIFRDLAEYVKQYFPQGIPWNPKGRPALEVSKALRGAPPAAALPAPPAPTAGGGPPPPPPPPPGPPPVLQIKETKAAPAQDGGGLGAVFSELNKGEAVTKGLRKVDKSEMTHKNPSLRANSTVPDGEGSARGKSPTPSKKPKPESMRVKKPPKKELDGNKWTIVSLPSPSLPFSHFNGGWCLLQEHAGRRTT